MFQHGLARIVSDKDLLFHLGYFGFCVLGLCINELFYSLLVSISRTQVGFAHKLHVTIWLQILYLFIKHAS